MAVGEFRIKRGIYYILAIQRWLMMDEDFDDYEDYLNRISENPENLDVYWRHLTEEPEGWQDVYPPDYPFPKGTLNLNKQYC